MNHSHVDYFSHRLPQQHQYHRRYGNVPAAVGWYPRHAGGVDVTDNCDDVANHEQTRSYDGITARHST